MERTLDWTPRKRHQKRICQDYIKEVLPGETSEGVEKPDKGRGGSQARVWLQLDCTLRELRSRRSWAFICPTHQSLLIATMVEPETQERMLVTQSCPPHVTPWTVAHQALLSVGFSRQEYWRKLPFPSPGDCPNPEIKPGSPALQADSLLSEPPGKPSLNSKVCPILHTWAKWL